MVGTYDMTLQLENCKTWAKFNNNESSSWNCSVLLSQECYCFKQCPYEIIK